MATYILIHGAWHGGWCWEFVTPMLKEQGHKVIAPDLPGMGDDKTPLTDITLDYWIQFVKNIVEQQDEQVILVGHSRGGVIISQVAEYCADKIKQLIYLSAFLIPNGETLWGTLQQHPRDAKRAPDLVLSEDKKTSIVSKTSIHNTFYNTTTKRLADRAATLLGPEPMISFLTPVRLTNENFARVPRTYIECIQDNALPIQLQRNMVATLPCSRVITMDTDHSPFYSAPDTLAEYLLQLA